MLMPTTETKIPNVDKTQDVGEKIKSAGDVVTFKVQNEMEGDFKKMLNKVEFKVIKSVLSKSSEVFAAMFKENYLNKANDSLLVELNDTCKADFSEFLKFMNVGEASMTLENATGLLYLSHKYMVQELKDSCYQYFHSQLDPENFATIMNICEFLGNQEFETDVNLYYRLHPYKVLESQNFPTLSKVNLLKILSLEKVNVKEIEIFKAATKWAKDKLEKLEKERALEVSVLAETNSHYIQKPLKTIREILGEEVVRNIRFSCMPYKDFKEIADKTDFLTEKDVTSLKKCIQTQCVLSSDGWLSIPRQPLWEICCNRIDQIKESLINKFPLNEISFQAKNQIFLNGLGIYGSRNMNQAYVEVHEVKNKKTNKTIFQQLFNIRQNTSTPQKVTFSKPVRLVPNQQYCVKVVYYGNDYLEHIETSIEKASLGAPYKLNLSSKKFNDVVFEKIDPMDQTFYNIPHLYFLKI